MKLYTYVTLTSCETVYRNDWHPVAAGGKDGGGVGYSCNKEKRKKQQSTNSRIVTALHYTHHTYCLSNQYGEATRQKNKCHHTYCQS